MLVTATEFKANIGRYLSLTDSEDIVITRNGKSVARLTNAREGKLDAVRSLRGILRGTDMTLEEVREKRLLKHEIID